MEKKTLFEIPVYCTSEDIFYRKWKRKKDEMYENFLNSGHTPKSARECVARCCYPKDRWRYNQIIGYITVSISPGNVWFNVFCSMDKRIPFNSGKKHFIEDWHIGGYHFFVPDRETNEQIREKIRQMLHFIQNEQLKKEYDVDFTVFENIFQYVDVRQAISDLTYSE